MTPLKAIKAKCLDCCCGQRAEVTACPSKDCPLWAYRKGHRPKVGNNPTEGESTKNTEKTEDFFEEEEE